MYVSTDLMQCFDKTASDEFASFAKLLTAVLVKCVQRGM
jgi:hypothetical protein